MSHNFFLTCLWFGFLLVVDAKNQSQCNERAKTSCPVNHQSCNNTTAGTCKTDNDCPCPQHCCVVNCKHACVLPAVKNAAAVPQPNGTAVTNSSLKNSVNQTAQILPRSGGSNQSTTNQKNQTKPAAKNDTAIEDQKNPTNSSSSTGAINATLGQNETVSVSTTTNQSTVILPRSSGSLPGTVKTSTVSVNKTTLMNDGTNNDTKPHEKVVTKTVYQTSTSNQSKAEKPLGPAVVMPRSLSGKPIFQGSGDDDDEEFGRLGEDNENAMLGGSGAEEIAPKDQKLDDEDNSDPDELAKRKAKARKSIKTPEQPAYAFQEPETTKVPKAKTQRPVLAPEEKEIMKKLRQKMRRTQHAQGFEHTTEPDDEEDEERKRVKTQKGEKRGMETEQQNLARRKLKEKEKRTSAASKLDFDKVDDKIEEEGELEGKKGKKTKKERTEMTEDTDLEEINRQTKRAKAQEKNSEDDLPEENIRKKIKSKPTEKYPEDDDQFTKPKTKYKDTDTDLVDTMSAGKINRRKMNEENIQERSRKPDQARYFDDEADGSTQRIRKVKSEDKFTDDDSLPKRKLKTDQVKDFDDEADGLEQITRKLKPEDKFAEEDTLSKTKKKPKSLGSLKYLRELPITGKPKLRRKNLGETEYFPEDTKKAALDSKLDDEDDLPKVIREPKRQRKLSLTEAPEIQTEPNIRSRSFPKSEPTEKMTDTGDVSDSSLFQKDGQDNSSGEGFTGKRKPTRIPSRRRPTLPPVEDLVMKHRDLILQMLYKVPRLLQKSVYKGRTVPPMVVKLPNGEYIYAPPFPGYDTKPLEPEEEKESKEKEDVKTSPQTPFTNPWNKFLLNSRPFGRKAPGNYPFPIIMVITKPDDIFNMFPEQGLPSFSQYYSQLKMPFYINTHFNKNKTTNEPEEILNIPHIQ